MSVAHRKVIDIIRSRRRNINTTDPKNYEMLDFLPSVRRATDDEAVLNLERDRIMKTLAVLAEAQREVIMSAYFESSSQSETCSRLNQPLGTIKTLVRLDMQKLQVKLEEDVSEPI